MGFNSGFKGLRDWWHIARWLFIFGAAKVSPPPRRKETPFRGKQNF